MAAREPDPRRRACVRGAAARGAKLRSSAVDLGPAHRHRATGAEPDEHVQRVAAAGAGRRRRRGCRGRAHADGARARGPCHPRRAGAGSDGRAVPGGRRRSPRGAAHHAAVARNAGGGGAARGEDRRDRHALRRAAPARGNPLMRVTVLTGGASAERAVAFAGAAQIVEALRARGHGVTAVDTVTGLLDPAGERRLLTTALGREPPAVAGLDERERAMLSNGLAALPAGRGWGGAVLLPPR